MISILYISLKISVIPWMIDLQLQKKKIILKIYFL